MADSRGGTADSKGGMADSKGGTINRVVMDNSKGIMETSKEITANNKEAMEVSKADTVISSRVIMAGQVGHSIIARMDRAELVAWVEGCRRVSRKSMSPKS